MKTKKGFRVRNVCGHQIIVAEGEENIDFTSIITLNESAALLWTSVEKKDNFTVDDLKQILLDNYEVSDDIAEHDAKALADKWIEAGIVEKTDGDE